MHVSMKFEDMNEAQRAKWLAWANSHDWGARDEPAEFIQHETLAPFMILKVHQLSADIRNASRAA